MSELLQEVDRIARKRHHCNYCNEAIEKGEVYELAKLKQDGHLYEWKNHKECGFIAQQLWCYIDPDEEMTEEDFQEGCAEFCHEFICPNCTEKTEDCYCCIHKIYDFLQTHDLKRVKENGNWMPVWRCYPKEAMS